MTATVSLSFRQGSNKPVPDAGVGLKAGRSSPMQSRCPDITNGSHSRIFQMTKPETVWGVKIGISKIIRTVFDTQSLLVCDQATVERWVTPHLHLFSQTHIPTRNMSRLQPELLSSWYILMKLWGEDLYVYTLSLDAPVGLALTYFHHKEKIICPNDFNSPFILNIYGAQLY